MRKMCVSQGANVVYADQRGHGYDWLRLLTLDKKCDIQKKAIHITSTLSFSPDDTVVIDG